MSYNTILLIAEYYIRDTNGNVLHSFSVYLTNCENLLLVIDRETDHADETIILQNLHWTNSTCHYFLKITSMAKDNGTNNLLYVTSSNRYDNKKIHLTDPCLEYHSKDILMYFHGIDEVLQLAAKEIHCPILIEPLRMQFKEILSNKELNYDMNRYTWFATYEITCENWERLEVYRRQKQKELKNMMQTVAIQENADKHI